MTETVNTDPSQAPEDPKVVLKKAAQAYLQVLGDHRDDAVAIMDAHSNFCDVLQTPAIENMIKNGSIEHYKDARLGLIMTMNPMQLMNVTLFRVSLLIEM